MHHASCIIMPLVLCQLDALVPAHETLRSQLMAKASLHDAVSEAAKVGSTANIVYSDLLYFPGS